MTIREAIKRADGLRPNAFKDKAKLGWLSELEGKICLDVFLLAHTEIACYEHPDDMNVELLVRHPHDDIYALWLIAQIDSANGEYDRYQNSLRIYNDAYGNFVRWFARTYEPAQGYKEYCGGGMGFFGQGARQAQPGGASAPGGSGTPGEKGAKGEPGEKGESGEDNPVEASLEEAQEGTETGLRSWSPYLVRQALSMSLDLSGARGVLNFTYHSHPTLGFYEAVIDFSQPPEITEIEVCWFGCCYTDFYGQMYMFGQNRPTLVLGDYYINVNEWLNNLTRSTRPGKWASGSRRLRGVAARRLQSTRGSSKGGLAV